MTTKTIALADANGYVGKGFAKEFLNQGFNLRILTRIDSVDSATIQGFKTNGASIHVISYDDEESITKALQGADVLVSTVSSSALALAQIPLIRAAKVAGVKLFFPSEYGGVYKDELNASPLVQAKNSVLKATQDVGLPFAVLSNGAFPEYCLTPPFGYNFAEKKVTIWGDGNAKASWTTIRSVAEWLANVLKTTPIEQLQNKHFCIQGNVTTANKIIELWERKHDAKLQVDYRPLKELDDRIQADKNDILAFVLRKLFSGAIEVGGEDNSLYSDWKPESLEAIL
ncbi:unnamed protein product [Rhizoctonia solani]|uniref:NmrA-like domain-containing protein n=1 Tax=Rhizoctonia solani TaxID=456999 RepID=A0A8H3D9H8_9AGAM|nr:unnamed protein product [Rhizoctonia solani]CAE6510353.1 unnamed protein product [Rhizoctonia solani]